jgi:hypothetical protein
MRFSIIFSAALIAASIAYVGRYAIGRVEVLGDASYVVYGLDTWTGRPFSTGSRPEN